MQRADEALQQAEKELDRFHQEEATVSGNQVGISEREALEKMCKAPSMERKTR